MNSREFAGINMTLELRIDNLTAGAAAINRAIAENISAEHLWVDVTSRQVMRKAIVDCTAEELSAIVSDMQGMWGKFESAKLIIRQGGNQEEIKVEQVSPSQIIAFSTATDISESAQIAADYLALNMINKSVPGKQMMAMLETDQSTMIIPKPVLTSHQDQKKGQNKQAERERNIHLVIDVISAGQ